MNSEITIIKPRTGWGSIDLAEVWQYRELLTALAMRDIKVRYKQTVLGIAWAVIQPLTAMIIFTLIFGRLAKIPSDGLPYPVFVFSGLLAWTFFSTALSTGGASLLSAGSMISKVYFPRIIVPLASIGVGIVDFCVSTVILLLLMLYYGVALSWQILLFPVFFFGLALTAVGFCAWLSAITVIYRDFRFVIPFMVQIWMYVTPVIYPVSFIPENWRWLIYLNPILGWVEGIRSAFLNQPVNWLSVAVSCVLTVLILAIGIRYFNKAERRFADVI
ncbi:MAG: ABC transporter permease [Pseudomonadota bacterium]